MNQPQLDKEFNEVMIESIDATMIALFSREVLDALYGHLQTTYSIEKAQVPYRLETLLSTLEKTFGTSSSKIISRAIARNLFSKLDLTFFDHFNRTLLEQVDEARTKFETSSK